MTISGQSKVIPFILCTKFDQNLSIGFRNCAVKSRKSAEKTEIGQSLEYCDLENKIKVTKV